MTSAEIIAPLSLLPAIINAGVVDTGDDALYPDFHRFNDTGDNFIAGNNDTAILNRK